MPEVSPGPSPVARWKGTLAKDDSDSEYSTESYTPLPPRRRRASSGNSNRTSTTIARPSSRPTSSRASRPPSVQSSKPPSRTSGRHRKNRGSIASSVVSGTPTVRHSSSDTEDERDRFTHRDLPRLATADAIPEEEPKLAKSAPPSSFPASLGKAKMSPSTPALTAGPLTSTDESEDSDAQDYQSAYSMSRPASTLGSLTHGF
jgi:hypothetical protein